MFCDPLYNYMVLLLVHQARRQIEVIDSYATLFNQSTNLVGGVSRQIRIFIL